MHCNFTSLSKQGLFFLLTFLGVFHAYAQENIAMNMQNAQECFARIDSSKKFTDNLNHVDMSLVPMGINQTISNMNITLAVNSAEIYPEYTELGLFLRLKVPGREKQPLMFGAKGIKLSHDGNIIGDAKLILLSDVEIPIGGKNVLIRLKGDYNNKTGQSQDLTYVTVDCKGFKQLGISAEIELSDKLCNPVDNDGKTISDKKVIGTFQTQVSDWTDIIAKVSFPAFEIKGLSGFIWDIKDAVFDFSDVRNDNATVFPQEYKQYLIPDNEALWKGVYVKDLSVTLPPQFSKGGNKRVSFFAQNMIIDDNGITGIFGADNLLSFNEGNASGWSFSVDHFTLRLMANNLEEASFKGTLGLPISEKSKLIYDGTISAGNQYVMRVSPVDKMSFDLFQGKAEIDPNSYVEFKVKDGKFRPEAMLHGRMGIEVVKSKADSIANKSKALTTIEGVEFRSLHLQTEVPYFSVEYFGYKGNATLLNFPISIKEIAVSAKGNEASLGIDFDLTLMDGAFKGGTRVEITGSMQNGELQQWKYQKTSVGKISLEATIAEMFTLKGDLTILNDDPIYGDGFAGDISASFFKKSPLSGLDVKVRGMFGKKDFRYWFVDGIAHLPGTGIPIGFGINLTGFGGGIAYKMKPQGSSKGAEGAILTATSMTYVPDANYSLDIKAAVDFNFVKDEVVHGEACFELAFNNNGGLNYAGFYGYAQFASVNIPGLDALEGAIGDQYGKIINQEKNVAEKHPDGVIKDLEKAKQYDPNEAGKLYADDDKMAQASITASLGIQFNFAESSFHANFDLYINAAGGIVRGASSNNRAGWAVIHVDPKDWYVHMGTPTDRIGLKISIGNILNIEATSYLMVGTQIPAAPGVPPQIASVLQEDPQNLDYMKDLNTINSGKGFAFGASIGIQTGDLTFLILYANFAAGMGFDIMLKDYGDAQCKGHSGAIGINGWYANGQSYAYMHGELGVKVNLWFMKAKVPIITADFATLMQAKLPNPSSFKAYLAVQANVMGVVHVNCRFKILVGDDCDLVLPGSSPVDMVMISDLSPADKAGDISVFTAPQATFSMAIGKSFDVQDDQGQRTFRIKLRDFTLSDGQQPIAGELKMNSNNDAASFYSHEVLPSQKDISAIVNVVFEEYKNGRWTPVYTSGKEAVETKSITFKTSDAPKDIPLENILYSYPVVDQKYYLKGESDKGYVQLQYGQTYLFPANLDNKIKLEDNAGNQYQADFKYDEPLKRIEYTMPTVRNSTAYTFRILSIAKGDTANIATASSTSLLNDKENGSINIENKQAVAETRTDIGKTLLTYSFSTSRYSTLKEKIDNIQKGTPAVNKLASDILMFEYETLNMEPFESADLIGTKQTNNIPLISASAASDDYYYTNKIYPLIYQDYPVQGQIRLKNRNEADLGVPPAKALPVMTQYLSQLEAGNYNGFVTIRFPYWYNLPQAYKGDFIDLQNQVINTFMQNNSANAAYRRFVNGQFPFISPGAYRIILQYVMPGDVKGTSSTFEYQNFIQ